MVGNHGTGVINRLLCPAAYTGCVLGVMGGPLGRLGPQADKGGADLDGLVSHRWILRQALERTSTSRGIDVRVGVESKKTRNQRRVSRPISLGPPRVVEGNVFMRQGRCEVLSSRKAPASELRESWDWEVCAGFKRRQHTQSGGGARSDLHTQGNRCTTYVPFLPPC